jgi:hypothetical protein
MFRIVGNSESIIHPATGPTRAIILRILPVNLDVTPHARFLPTLDRHGHRTITRCRPEEVNRGLSATYSCLSKNTKAAGHMASTGHPRVLERLTSATAMGCVHCSPIHLYRSDERRNRRRTFFRKNRGGDCSTDRVFIGGGRLEESSPLGPQRSSVNRAGSQSINSEKPCVHRLLAVLRNFLYRFDTPLEDCVLTPFLLRPNLRNRSILVPRYCSRTGEFPSHSFHGKHLRSARMPR